MKMLIVASSAWWRCFVFGVILVLSSGRGVRGAPAGGVLTMSDSKGADIDVDNYQSDQAKTSGVVFKSSEDKSFAEQMPMTSFFQDDVTRSKLRANNATTILSDDRELNDTLSHMYDLITYEGDVRYPLENDLMELDELKSILDFLEAESGADIDPAEYNADDSESQSKQPTENRKTIPKTSETDQPSSSDVEELGKVAASTLKSRTKRSPSPASQIISSADVMKVRRPSLGRTKRDVSLTSSNFYNNDDYYTDDLNDSGIVDYATEEGIPTAAERKDRWLNEVKAEEKLLNALVMQRRVEKAREAAIDDLINGIESGEIEVSVMPPEDDSEENVITEKRSQLKPDQPLYIPVIHKGMPGFFIPDFSISKRSSKEVAYFDSGSDDDDDEWQAVVPESYRASL